MNIVILGCGRSGATLALQLSSRGHSVTLIEKSPESLRRLGKSVPCKVVIGNGLDVDILEKAGVKDADAFFAVTHGDNTNLMAAQIVQRKFKVPRVCCKVADPNRANAYKQLGIFCINPSSLVAGMCRDWLLDIEYSPIDHYNTLVPEQEV